MRILSNSSVALAGVLALAPCIPAANGQTFPAGVTPVRGAVTAVTANSVTVQTQQGPVFVQLVQPVKVFTRMPSDLGHITNKTFVGVTSAKGAPIAATIGMPPMTAFCRSSKLARPERSTRWLRSGTAS